MIEDISRSVSYMADGETTTFPVPFQFFELAVYVGTDRVAEGIQYSVVQGAPGLAGDVVFNTPPADGFIVSIEGETVIAQQTDYINTDSFPVDSHEKALDRLTMIAQELRRSISRVLRITPTATGEIPVLDFVANPNSVIVTTSNGGIAYRAIADFVTAEDVGGIPHVVGDLEDVDLDPAPADGDALTWDTATLKWVAYPVPRSIGELSDVDLSVAPANNQILTYDTLSQTFKARDPALPALQLGQITNVDLATPPTTGQTIVYDELTGKWRAANYVTGPGNTTALDDLTDVNVTSTLPTTGDFLQWVSGLWRPGKPTPKDVYGIRLDAAGLSIAAGASFAAPGALTVVNDTFPSGAYASNALTIPADAGGWYTIIVGSKDGATALNATARIKFSAGESGIPIGRGLVELRYLAGGTVLTPTVGPAVGASSSETLPAFRIAVIAVPATVQIGSGGGGAGTVTVGYGLTGNGSPGTPLAVSLPTATTVADGLMSSGDKTLLNAINARTGVVTTGANGIMSAADKTKLDGIAANAIATVAVAAPLTGNGTTGSPVTAPVATGLVNGLMSAADKTKLDGIPPGGSSGLTSVSVASPLTGDGTSGTPVGVNITSLKTAIGNATTGTAGLMSAADKTTLNAVDAATALVTTTANGLMRSTDKARLDKMPDSVLTGVESLSGNANTLFAGVGTNSRIAVANVGSTSGTVQFSRNGGSSWSSSITLPKWGSMDLWFSSGSCYYRTYALVYDSNLQTYSVSQNIGSVSVPTNGTSDVRMRVNGTTAEAIGF